MNRRKFLIGSAALGATAALPRIAARAALTPGHEIVAGKKVVNFAEEAARDTPVWCYNGTTPGPVLRVRQGEIVRAQVTNELDEGTTVHWHGIRAANSMDGVPYLTQPLVEPGAKYDYEFAAHDAGTFWYHPHANSAVQVGRGLAGALIVEELAAPEVDRDVVWVLDDWRLQEDGALAPFGSIQDAAHGGRLGNLATVNGIAGGPLHVRSGERIRLRLINAATARVFALRFRGHDAWRIALDGHPIAPERTRGSLVVIAPGSRVDLIMDMIWQPGEVYAITDEYYARNAYTLTSIAYDDQAPLRTEPLPEPAPLAANPVALPDEANAERHEMVFQGGAMGSIDAAMYKGETMALQDLAAMGMVWAMNGDVLPPMEAGDVGDPMLDLKLGRTYLLRWRNDTAWDHPIHLHGHSFHLLADNGQRLDQPLILDTVLIQPNRHVDVAFVADNPGDWALHCHVLEHAQAGMMGYVRVS